MTDGKFHKYNPKKWASPLPRNKNVGPVKTMHDPSEMKQDHLMGDVAGPPKGSFNKRLGKPGVKYK